MIRWLLHRKLAAEEKKLGESVDYLRHVVDVSPTAFLRFASILPMANSRRALPKEIWYAAQLVALQREDCGPCLQITVNLALRDKVHADLIRAVLDGTTKQQFPDVDVVCEFAKSIGQSDETALREQIRKMYGDRGLVELSFAIASARIPPTVKQVLGYAQSCQEVTIHTSPGEQDGNR